jgi:hypothetical protein
LAIVKQNWSAQDPIVTGNREAAFDGCLTADLDAAIWRNTAGIDTTTPYTSGNLSTAWVSKTGATYYSLISARDRAGTAPTGAEYVSICFAEQETEAYRPVLTVAYTEAERTPVQCRAPFWGRF